MCWRSTSQPKAWKVQTVSCRATAEPTRSATRSFISAAALLVKVTARMLEGSMPFWTMYAIRWTMTRVLPLPAPARTRSGPWMVLTALRCGGLSRERSSMRATIYQESAEPARRPRRPFWGLALALAAASAPGCKQASMPSAAPPVVSSPAASGPAGDAGAQATPPLDGRSVHFTRLLELAPDKLLEYEGGKPAASTLRIGEVAVSEVERTYVNGEQSVKLRLVDTSLNRGARAPKPSAAFEDEQRIGRPVQTSGASGYVEFEKEQRRAVANLIVSDRVLVTLAMENARGPEDVERLASTLDLRRLEAILAALPPESAPAR